MYIAFEAMSNDYGFCLFFFLESEDTLNKIDKLDRLRLRNF